MVAVTGVTATKPAETETEWTVEELKAAKPALLYFYVEGMDGKNAPNDENYKFSQSFENGGLGEKVVGEINDHWRAKKVGLSLEADRKEEKNQARIEFWSFTGVKLGNITIKESNQLSGNSLKASLKQLRAKNDDMCAREIKRIEERQKARDKMDKEAITKETAAK